MTRPGQPDAVNTTFHTSPDLAASFVETSMNIQESRIDDVEVRRLQRSRMLCISGSAGDTVRIR